MRPRRPRPRARPVGRPARRAAGRGAARAGRDRRLPGHRAVPAGLPVPAGVPGEQLARRGAADPGRPGALRGADRRLRAGRLPAALLRRPRPRRPACSACPTCRCGWCRWCRRWPASRCWPGWSSARPASAAAGTARRGPARRDLLRHGHLVRRRPGSTRCSSRSASPPCTPPGGCAAPAAPSPTGLLLAAAFLTKQNGLAEGVAVLAALAFGPRRRLAWRRRADRRRGPRDQHARARARPAAAGTCTTSSS